MNIGGINLTQANYGNISSEIRLIDSLKFYQRSLGELSSALTDEEKIAVKKLPQKFLNEHFYFSTVWPYLSFKKKEKILEITSEGKGIIPYLSEIIESRFQAMQNTYGFNSRKCNSASSISGCIEREMSKIILALWTKYDHVEIFEETVIGGFSCVNTRLAFDSQILLPRLTDKIDLKNNPLNKDFNYKVVYNLKMDNEKTKKKCHH